MKLHIIIPIVFDKNIHVIPCNDLREHEYHETCHCRPEVIVENNCKIVIHHSYDKRELREELIEQIKNIPEN
jgi:hypothetical protein